MVLFVRVASINVLKNLVDVVFLQRQERGCRVVEAVRVDTSAALEPADTLAPRALRQRLETLHPMILFHPTARSLPDRKCSRSVRFSTLPRAVFGKSVFRNSTSRGIL